MNGGQAMKQERTSAAWDRVAKENGSGSELEEEE